MTLNKILLTSPLPGETQRSWLREGEGWVWGWVDECPYVLDYFSLFLQQKPHMGHLPGNSLLIKTMTSGWNNPDVD